MPLLAVFSKGRRPLDRTSCIGAMISSPPRRSSQWLPSCATFSVRVIADSNSSTRSVIGNDRSAHGRATDRGCALGVVSDAVTGRAFRDLSAAGVRSTL